jgi:hypothetical protein
MACCTDDQLCEHCYGRELLAKCRQAEVIGQCWAERICRGELRAQPSWPEHDERTLLVARRLVGAVAKDPRLLRELAAACSRGASAWVAASSGALQDRLRLDARPRRPHRLQSVVNPIRAGSVSTTDLARRLVVIRRILNQRGR